MASKRYQLRVKIPFDLILNFELINLNSFKQYYYAFLGFESNQIRNSYMDSNEFSIVISKYLTYLTF